MEEEIKIDVMKEVEAEEKSHDKMKSIRHMLMKSDSDLGSFKGFKKPPRIPGKSSSRNVLSSKSYNSLKNMTYDNNKFFDQ